MSDLCGDPLDCQGCGFCLMEDEMTEPLKTVYKCTRQRKDGSTEAIHYEKTQEEAIRWLEQNGGGIFEHTLHRFKFKVDPCE